MKKCTLAPWKVLKSRPIYSAPPWVKLSVHRVQLPNGQVVEDYHRLRLPDYSAVVGYTPQRRIILQRLYKHGIGKVSLILPGGLIEPGEKPIQSAKRELLEETGYIATNWRSLGRFTANANYGCGTAHMFLAEKARKVAEPVSGDLEEMEIVLMTEKEVIHAIRDGEMLALGAVAAVALAMIPELVP
jgi:ADP-ribose pyrophosphatase